MCLHPSYLKFVLQYCPSQVQTTCQKIQGLSSNNFAQFFRKSLFISQVQMTAPADSSIPNEFLSIDPTFFVFFLHFFFLLLIIAFKVDCSERA